MNLIQWFKCYTNRRLQIKLAGLEAQEKVWRAFVECKETNSYFIEKLVNVRNKIAKIRERLK